MADYLRELAAEQDVISGYDNVPIARYNIPPSTRVQILHGTEGGIHIDSVHWGWAPFWAKGKRPDPINARVETVTTGKLFKQPWPNGGANAPAKVIYLPLHPYSSAEGTYTIQQTISYYSATTIK